VELPPEVFVPGVFVPDTISLVLSPEQPNSEPMKIAIATTGHTSLSTRRPSFMIMLMIKNLNIREKYARLSAQCQPRNFAPRNFASCFALFNGRNK
jgi:hypothetical protein